MKPNLQVLYVLIKRLMVLFIIYQISRLFYFIININHFPDVTFLQYLRMMWGGLRFDLTGILYLNILFIVLSLFPFAFTNKKYYQNALFWLFIIINSLGFAANTMDAFYFDFVLKRSTVEVFMFAGEGNIGNLFLQFFQDYWIGIILWIVLVYATYKYYKSIHFPNISVVNSLKYTANGIVVLLITIYFSVVGIRGGFTRDTRPINMNNAGAYINKPLEMAIVLNTPFTIIRTLKKQAFKPVHYFRNDKIEHVFTPKRRFVSDTIIQKKNIVILIVESLAKEYTGLLNKNIAEYKGYTPFLDSLMLQSHTFTNAYANGRKSIDAMPSILTSVPSLVQPYVLSPYGTNKLYGLGDVLKKEGYKTAFFHGAPNGSMGFDAIVNLAGFDEYYGMTEYGNNADFDGHWGIPDDLFLQFTAKTLDTFKQPFVTTLFTLSSHHPFKVPKGFEGKFNEGKLPIHKVVRYTDYSLKHFFKTASKSAWYNNTIFVISADHCNQSYLPEYNSSVGNHAIPIIFFEPGNRAKINLDSTLTQQIDIMPRLLRELNYSGDILSFGNDPVTDKSPFVVNFSGNTWEFMQGNYLLRFRNEKTTGLFNYKKDRLLKKNLISHPPVNIKPMLQKLKAFIQQYKNRLIENRLTPFE